MSVCPCWQSWQNLTESATRPLLSYGGGILHGAPNSLAPPSPINFFTRVHHSSQAQKIGCMGRGVVGLRERCTSSWVLPTCQHARSSGEVATSKTRWCPSATDAAAAPHWNRGLPSQLLNSALEETFSGNLLIWELVSITPDVGIV